VMLGLHASHTTLAGRTGGCAYGSAVVRSDANGRFSYRATVQRAGNGGSSFWIFVYHPDYAGRLRWHPSTDVAVSTFPLKHAPDDGTPFSIMIAKRAIDEWEALEEIDEYAQQACLLPTVFDNGHAEFSRMRFARALALHCGPDAGAESFPPWDVMDFLEARLYEQSVYAMPLGPERNWPTRNDERARRSHVKRQLLLNYPWESTKDSKFTPRQLTSEEKAAFCSLYSLPIKNLINREFLP
jgi:hypothetical protein